MKKSSLFIGLTLIISWLLAFTFFYLGGQLNTTVGIVTLIIYMMIPMLVAIVVQKVVYKESLSEPLGISFRLNRWFIIAGLLPPILVFATIGVSVLIPGVEYSPDINVSFIRFVTIFNALQFEQMDNQVAHILLQPGILGLIQVLFIGITVNAILSLGQELGWRGFLQNEFSFMGFWKSSAVIGSIWGIWYAPLIIQGYNYPEHPWAGVFMMIIWCILIAPIFSYIRIKAKSVLAVAIIHGSINATAGYGIMLIMGGNDLLTGVTGAAGFCVLIILNIGLFLYDGISSMSQIIQALFNDMSSP